MHELFAEAVERLKAGEPAATIVASYPADVQAEISELLAIVEMADQVAVQPLPQRSMRQRSLARAQFLQQAGAIRAELEETLGAPVLTQQSGGASTSGKKRAAQPSWRERLAMGWGSLFDSPLLRLAPLAAVTLAVYLALFWTVRTAEAALPGDAVYPIKQWVREQKINLSPPEQRVGAIREAQDQLALEAKTLATVLQTRPEARSELALEYSEDMIYYGRHGDLLMIGPFLVAPNYQPDAAEEQFVAMELAGTPEPGSTVRLTYRVLPGNPSVVQGVRAVVVDTPKPAPEPTATPTRGDVCRIALPANWIPYAVRPGDSLAGLANRSGASVDSIRRVNCVYTIDGINTLYLPDSVYVLVTPASMPTPIPTLPPTLTPVPTATSIPQLTATPMPTGDQTEVPTGVPTGIPTGIPTGVATVEPTAQTTVEPTGEPGQTPAETPGGTPGQTPAATPMATPTESPTALPTESPSVTATSEPNGTVAPTDQATATVVAATEAATEAPTSLPTAVPTSAPTLEPTPVPTQVPPTQAPPTEAPPTAAPPTAAPPTQALPTQALPTPIPPAPEPPTPAPPAPEPATPVPAPVLPAPEPPTPIPAAPLPPAPEPPTPGPALVPDVPTDPPAISESN